MKLKSFLSLVLLAAAALLAGCSDRPASGAPSDPQSGAPKSVKAPPTPDGLEGMVQGVSLGSPMREKAVYVFFDTQCKYCTKLWFSAEPLQAQARFVWVPVALLNKASLSQGAAILGAENPLVAMQEHELSFQEGKGGLTATTTKADAEAAVHRNTEVFKSFDATGVPFIFAVNPKTGEIVRHSGTMPTADLAAKLGLAAPAGAAGSTPPAK